MQYAEPIIEYLCPACGNPYFGSDIVSYSVFRSELYSDGYVEDFCGSKPWLTRCPRCKSYFANEHLFRIPMTASMRRIAQHEAIGTPVSRCDPAMPRYRSKNLCGRLSSPLDEGESVMSFLEKASYKGLYFPIRVSEGARRSCEFRLKRSLWWEYNRAREEVEDFVYDALCNDLIDMLKKWPRLDEYAELTLAELYRNIADFESSLEHLKKVEITDKTAPIVSCIMRNIEDESTLVALVLSK